MNELIQKLALDAAKNSDWKPGLGNPQVQEYMEKFAERVIRECMISMHNLVDHTDPYDDWTCGYGAAIENATNVIKEHFGVK